MKELIETLDKALKEVKANEKERRNKYKDNSSK